MSAYQMFWLPLTLLMARFLPVIIVSPFGVLQRLPSTAQVGLAFLLALAMWPGAVASGHALVAPPATVVAWYLSNAALGLGVALVALFLASVLSVIGQSLDASFGWALVQTLSPNGVTSSLMGTLLPLVGDMLFVNLGGLSILFGVLMRSVARWPVNRVLIANGDWLHGLALLAASSWDYGLEMAVPIFGILLMVNLVSGVLARLIPQMPVLTLQFPLLMVVGTLVVLIEWPSLIQLVEGLLAVMESAVNGVMYALLKGV